MELIILIALIGWGIASLSKNARKRQEAEQKGQLDPQMRGASVSRMHTEEERPMRPADVDLPGQSTAPIHWDGIDQTSPQVHTSNWQPIPEGDPSLLLRPSEQGTLAEKQRNEQKAAKANTVTIPGLNLSIDGDTLVKGVIFSEILNRKQPVGRHR